MIISKGKVTNLKIPGVLLRKVNLEPPLFGFFLSIVMPNVSFLKLVIFIEHIKIKNNANTPI